MTMRITTNKQLKALCDDFLAKITLRKNKAIEYEDLNKDFQHIPRRWARYTVKHGKTRADDDEVWFMEYHDGCAHYYVDRYNRLSINNRTIEFIFNGYSYTNRKGSSSTSTKKREILLNLRSELEKIL